MKHLLSLTLLILILGVVNGQHEGHLNKTPPLTLDTSWIDKHERLHQVWDSIDIKSMRYYFSGQHTYMHYKIIEVFLINRKLILKSREIKPGQYK